LAGPLKGRGLTKLPEGFPTRQIEGVKKWVPNQKISRKGAVRLAHGPPFDSAQGQ